MDKTIYLLIGKKGSGKTYIGKLLEKELIIRFLSVEPYFLHVKNDYEDTKKDSFNESWEKIEFDIDNLLKKEDSVIFESLGTYNSFREFLKRIKSKYNVKLIKINTNKSTCIKRIKKRDNTNHVPMNEELIKNINKIADKEKYQFDLIIDNEKSLNQEIINEFKRILNN